MGTRNRTVYVCRGAVQPILVGILRLAGISRPSFPGVHACVCKTGRRNATNPRDALSPPTPTHLAGGAGRRGWRDEKMLDVRAFLALRQLPPLAEGGVWVRNWPGLAS